MSTESTETINPEVTGLMTSLANMDKLVSWLGSMAERTATFSEEMSKPGNGVSGPVLEFLATSVDNMNASKAAAENARTELAKQIEIRDRMFATPGHGSAEFIKGE